MKRLAVYHGLAGCWSTSLCAIANIDFGFQNKLFTILMHLHILIVKWVYIYTNIVDMLAELHVIRIDFVAAA